MLAFFRTSKARAMATSRDASGRPARDATAASGAPITFVVPGRADSGTRSGTGGAHDASLDREHAGWPGQIKASVRMGARRSGGELTRVVAQPGEDVVVLHIADGPTLWLHPETARDLMLSATGATRSGRAAQSAQTADEVDVPADLRWTGLEQAAPTRSRGFLGRVAIKAFELVTGLQREPAAKLVTRELLAHIDGQVDPGLYALQPERLEALKGPGGQGRKITAAGEIDASGPMLVLLHGTFVDTASTFGKLWVQHPQAVRQLFEHYGNRVYALDHPTLGESPVANARRLVALLPDGARLHLATHSRGGLVAEVLARVAGQDGVSDEALRGFEADTTTRDELRALGREMRGRGIRVERVVRVACPARGTLLASRRLDAYLSVLQWTLRAAGVPALPALVGFIAEVARRRAEPGEIPGLAAMIPDTPLLDWLNGAEDPVPGDLRVIAGDIQGDGVTSWLKTLLADAFYWTDNDLVVQTRSMYAGSPRLGGASFLLDRGGKTTHFAYFVNERTAEAFVEGLLQPDPPGFRPIGPLSWAGRDASGVRAAVQVLDATEAANRPAVFVLPGILGSHLRVGGRRIWLSLHLIGGLEQLRWQPAGADGRDPNGVEPDGPIGMVYRELIEHLQATHEVRPFAFDWRRPIEEEAARLADALDAALDARAVSGQPVRLLAHSMGGVVARAVQLVRPQTWERLMSHEGARVLMLGTPNGGSWAPMQVLSGDDTFGNALAAFGSPLRDRQAREVMAGMPGFIQLQAGLTDPQLALDREETWRRLADDDLKQVREINWWHQQAGEPMLNVYRWGVPPQSVLDRAVRLRERLDRQREQDLPRYADRLLLVVGQARFTPDGYEWGPEGLSYRDAVDGGDGRVPLPLAQLPGVRTWQLDADHGALPDTRRAFDAYVELLQSGQTARLPLLAAGGATRSGAVAAEGAAAAAEAVRHVLSRPARSRSAALPALGERRVFDTVRGQLLEERETVDGPAALRVSVLNGDLAFVRQPLMIGHYRSLQLTGSEAMVDRLVGGAMGAAITAGLYPQDIGAHQIFLNLGRDPDNPWRLPRPHCAIVVGLGSEGELREADLVRTVRQGVLAWAQRLAEQSEGSAEDFELAATLIGSGGVGMMPAIVARAIAQGVQEANGALARTAQPERPVSGPRRSRDELPSAPVPAPPPLRWPCVSRLTLVELYLERAADAWHGLRLLATAHPERFVVDPTVTSGSGPLRRMLDSGYRSTDHDLVRALGDGPDRIAFTIDSRRARTELRAQQTQGSLIRQLVRSAAHDRSSDWRLGRALYQLLVPPEIDPFFGGGESVVLELDSRTAAIPWELLDTRGQADGPRSADGERPWAIRSKLLRRLQTQDYRTVVRDASADDSVLVIGEPECDPELYDPLPGALAEAKAVSAQLLEGGQLPAERVRTLLQPDAEEVINTLLERDWRVVHVAGHGEPGGSGGVVLSGGTFLGPREIQTMRVVPELVFVNCCHLAARDLRTVLGTAPGRDPAAERGGLANDDLASFAAGVAEALIQTGVRCVIAAGWAVEDQPAEVFATTFYRALFAGRRFIDAVAQAREAAYSPDSNTWAAYQCYGDPDWSWRSGTGDAQATRRPADEYAGISSALGLCLALEEIAVRADPTLAGRVRGAERIRHLEGRFADVWGAMGAVAEAFGTAWRAVGDHDAAIAWYRRALAANDASASVRCHEQLGNLTVRRAWRRFQHRQSDADTARAEITEAMRALQASAALSPTAERLSLVGSAWKRKALVAHDARLAALKRGDAGQARQRAADERGDLEQAAEAYRQAEDLARRQGLPNLFYPALNRMALDLALHAATPGWAGFDAAHVAEARASLLAKSQHDPDFWSVAGLVELDLYDALAAGQLSLRRAALESGYQDLHARLSRSTEWRTLADQGELVLEPYIERSRGSERDAARALLAFLQRYAGT
jgi:tetratricopeptide (TPR) repeat protein